jgi:outer membrane protein OmpA-like peptidoglycan-associated protein
MKTDNLKTKTFPGRPRTYMLIRNFIIGALIFAGLPVTLIAQNDSIIKPSWWFGIAAGANFNFYEGTTQRLNADVLARTAFHNGQGVGLYIAPLIEYHRPTSRWGVMLQAGYDNRKGKFEDAISPCNCPATLSTKLTYVTVEPSLRFAPFKRGFYLYAGPRLAFNLDKSFLFQQKRNPAFPEQPEDPEVSEEFSDINTMLLSMQVGAGYDIYLSGKNKLSQFVLSPFVALHPYFGQDPRSVESWNITTVRGGIALKFGRGHKYNPESDNKPAVAAVAAPTVNFSVNSPENIPVARRVRETFPLRNYVFFDLGSTEIPDRYVLLKKSEVATFKEDQLEVFKPKHLTGRSERQMIAYYNILNIVGDRMGKNPGSTIALVGSSEQGNADGKAMAESVKKYLVEVFAINGSRITTEGREKPEFPSQHTGGTQELTLLREGDRRVSIASSSPQMLMEFQSGPDAPLKPVELGVVQEAPLDSYVTFNAEGSNEAFTSWSIEAKDKDGKIQTFGPYTQTSVAIPGKAILGTRPSGDYQVTMVGKTKSGDIVRKETKVHMALWTPAENEEGMRYSVIFGFNESEAIKMYDKYLTEVVAPKIPKNGKVIIHGHSDVIGDAVHNQKLALARAKDVESILVAAVSKAGRKDVKFEVHGFGEDEALAPFANKYPEERFYNRTVVIDIIPQK